ncbi:MAG: putative glycosyltransferase [Ilumatobacteraceae bacterium]|nr:putative glycosyltransferase [Ilumatobacteraceae bacterium]
MKLRRILLIARVAAAVMALSRIVRAARRRPPLVGSTEPLSSVAVPAISVIVPARDEAQRIGPLLDLVCGAPGVTEVVVVDDQSTDATAVIATAAGARVVDGAPLPAGWAGKAWALQQGLEAATGDWVVMLDADTRPDRALPRSLVARAVDDGLDIVSLAGRFDCPTVGALWLHPAMLTSLVYRFGPPGHTGAIRPGRQMANGQCMAARRTPLLGMGGLTPVAGEVVEDVALVRHLAALGWSTAMLDGPTLLTTRMFDDARSTFAGWGRSLALPGVESRNRQLLDLAIVVLTQALPLPRLLLRRGDVLDVALAAMRLGTLAGTRDAYCRRGLAYWTSPAADAVAVAALLRGILAPRQPWRGRAYST